MMKLLEDFCEYLSDLTSINKDILSVVLSSIIIILIFSTIKYVLKLIIIGRVENSRKVYFISKSSQVFLNIIEVIILMILWSNYA